MSRIYDNKPLSSVAVDNIEFPKSWQPEVYVQGDGVIIEGVVKGYSRVSISDLNKKKVRYIIFQVSVRRAHRRKFTDAGVEVEPNFGDTEKVRTGYLNSSYKTVEKGTVDTLSFTELSRLIQPAELINITQKHRIPDCLVLWIDEASFTGIEIAVGDAIRFRTKGNSLFIDSVTKLEPETQPTLVKNYTGGEGVGASWTDKIMAVKGTLSSETQVAKTPAQPGDCADDDEWND